ncbi:hypothetical protein PsAD2_04044 [Pseudovibrio axinellae]|uniref:Alanine racemase N-terminal domain-containing protein n=1 Tax=Pseudovibrio axinellae TaxID=989403 RepID=A0A165U1M9_9HYPH|nr:alanine racemase [Pseudovibrio axinellae]KZL09444.1 hypothetical protein PsAD2_04044 [Pseudovibrio axinellae]SEQ64713.1 Predicted amino acid racemase [Pseudovibrio axinellae]
MTINLVCDKESIRHNTRVLSQFLKKHDVTTMVVTKSLRANQKICDIFLQEGLYSLGDSRLKNIIQLRGTYQNKAELCLMRPPSLAEIPETVQYADSSFHCTQATIAETINSCHTLKKSHKLGLIADVGHGREGFELSALRAAAELIRGSPYTQLDSIACYLSNEETSEHYQATFEQICDLRKALMADLQLNYLRLSVGSSLCFGTLYKEPHLLASLDEYRLGTAILLGISSSVGNQKIEGLSQNTFHLEVDIMQEKGRQLIIPIGLCDVNPNDLICPNGVKVEHAFSDHLVLSRDSSWEPKVRGTVVFQLNYYSLNRLMMSPYVTFRFTTL